MEARSLPRGEGSRGHVPEAGLNRRNLVMWFVLAATGLAVGAWWQWGDLGTVREQRRVWSQGVVVPVEHLEVEEERTSGEGLASFFRTYHYEARATYEVGGKRVQTEATFATILRSIDRSAPAEVRVDPHAPERFVTSWGHERLGAMACFLAWKWSVTALWVAAMLFGALAELRPRVVERLEDFAHEEEEEEDDARESTPTLGARVLGGAALLLIASAVLSLAGMFLDDVVRRFGTYLEDALGLLLGFALLALVGTTLDLLRRRRA